MQDIPNQQKQKDGFNKLLTAAEAGNVVWGIGSHTRQGNIAASTSLKTIAAQ